MRLLKVIFRNEAIFKEGVVVDFTNGNSVRKSPNEPETLLKAFKLKTGIYSQVLMGFTGLNATGKTTVLEMLSVVAQVLFRHESLNMPAIQSKLVKVVSSHVPFEWEVFFLHRGRMYRLKSEIIEQITAEEPNRELKFVYKEEILQEKSFSSVTRKTLFDFAKSQSSLRSQILMDSPYLQDDDSIASRIKDIKETIHPLGLETNINVAAFRGAPPEFFLNVFDPNIKKLNITKGEDGKVKSELLFKNQERKVYGGDSSGLLFFLSAGTIKGLSLGPVILGALKSGGYVFIDEIENHFNKKIVEWFMELFSDTRTNPYGACLVFSTHYPELLDTMDRMDNIYITRRDKENFCSCVRYSDMIKRNELSKSRVILENAIGGTAPRFQDLQAAKNVIADFVRKGE